MNQGSKKTDMRVRRRKRAPGRNAQPARVGPASRDNRSSHEAYPADAANLPAASPAGVAAANPAWDSASDVTEVAPHTASQPSSPAEPAVRILHLEAGFVVVDKPAGLASVLHPEQRERLPKRAWPPTLERLLPPLIARMERQRGAQGRSRANGRGAGKASLPPLRVVQRLDIGTSGVLVFARTRSAERALAEQFRRHSVQRRYLAVVRGVLHTPRRLESLLVDNRGDGLRGSHPSRGRRAVTHVSPQEALGEYTLVGCRLETGRTHQIRIHLAEVGLPLCGEPLYVRPRFGEPVAESSGAPGIMLHAGELGFNHPDSGQPLLFKAAPPPQFQAFVARLRQRSAGMRPASIAVPVDIAGPVTGSPAAQRPGRKSKPRNHRAPPRPRR